MSEITINQDQCSGCGICSVVCPYLIIRIEEKTQKAMVIPQAAPYCSTCGHCGAICPEGAISVTSPDIGPIPVLTGQTLPTTGQMSQLIMSRRSIRDYTKKTIPRETFEEIINLVRYAPTGMNDQSVHWLVIQKPEDVRELAGKVIEWARETVKTQPDHVLTPLLPMIIGAWDRGADKICHGAPGLVFAHGHKDNPVAFIDSVIALTHLDLTAPVFGLGTCWAGIVQIALDSSPELMNSLGLPADHKTFYGMMIGYPKYSYPRIPGRNSAKITWK